MPVPRKILLIDNHPDNRSLLARTLIRKFPKVILSECHDSDTAVQVAASEGVDVVVLHRSDDAGAVELVRLLRHVNEDVQILVLSGVDRSEAVLKAGANGFLNFDEWLRIGTVVENLVRASESSPK